jgi:hypothetical protein
MIYQRVGSKSGVRIGNYGTFVSVIELDLSVAFQHSPSDAK